ncbi:pimeloyl-ACP methyl ester carboxylesterase [Stackebrandtia albiflava]|uniref:Pimeloyl-ACP methyl ester carboxylesterase n=1 Tax=Stackebrandtia albiflava TaxID=406432 RepID=A0A562V4W8_9ACTN|nr:alpha/beta hydrolase [Stackebrandtia albiflava]TWJ12939.1 pimeloyl-ACP methyl ester carboxylesterase [Stackebrandtia albiflava]
MKTIALEDGTIAYRESGPADGPLVVLAHGMGDTHATYRFLAPELAAAGYRVITPDLRGAGESSLEWPRYGTLAVAEDLTALIAGLGGPAVLIGHSFTAGSVAHIAADRPDLVSALVLLGPAVRHEKPNPVMNLVARLVTGNAALWTMYYRSLYPGAKPADFSEYLAGLKRSLRRPGGMRAVRGTLDSFTVDRPPELSKVTAPALVVMGGKDGDFSDPAGEARRIATTLAGPSDALVLPESGHYPHVDAAAEVTAAVREFLAAH